MDGMPTTLAEFWARLQSDVTFASHTWALLAPVVALSLFFVTANYSRYYTGWSLLRCALPGAVGWFVMEVVSPGLYLWSFLRAGGDLLRCPLAAMWLTHYTYRCFVYPALRWRTMKPMPLEIALLSVMFNSVNGYLNGASAADFTLAGALATRTGAVCLAVGACMWLLGFVGNIHSDETLRALRKSPAEAGVYKVPPPVGMHRYLMSPNYSCECFEWLGYYVASRFAPAAMTFFVWTLANLGPRAYTNYKWCQKRFGKKMPKNRRIFIPFIW